MKMVPARRDMYMWLLLEVYSEYAVAVCCGDLICVNHSEKKKNCGRDSIMQIVQFLTQQMSMDRCALL